LESELTPLQDECRDTIAQRDSLQKEVELLRSETERWKARTNHLIEKCNKFDPEEHKRAMYVATAGHFIHTDYLLFCQQKRLCAWAVYSVNKVELFSS